MSVRACAPSSNDIDWAAFATAAERTGFDTLVIAVSPGFDPLTAAALIMPRTHRIRLAPEVGVDRGEPFTVARGLAALDHLSKGRLTWYVGAITDAARAREFVEVTRRLWQSWQADAISFDKADAVFSDPAKVARINHQGTAFQVRGPLNTPRPPQGRIPLMVDAGSPLADLADIVIGRDGATVERRALGDLR